MVSSITKEDEQVLWFPLWSVTVKLILVSVYMVFPIGGNWEIENVVSQLSSIETELVKSITAKSQFVV